MNGFSYAPFYKIQKKYHEAVTILLPETGMSYAGNVGGLIAASELPGAVIILTNVIAPIAGIGSKG